MSFLLAERELSSEAQSFPQSKNSKLDKNLMLLARFEYCLHLQHVSVFPKPLQPQLGIHTSLLTSATTDPTVNCSGLSFFFVEEGIFDET